jgi:hypothetical protein
LKNYDKNSHLDSWQIEKQIAEVYPELEWHNADWTGIEQYDSKEKGLPDFSIRGTNIKIELQYAKAQYDWVYVQKRRLYEVDNAAGTYGKRKDLKNTFLVLTNGTWFKVLDLSISHPYKELDNFQGQRQSFERVYSLHQSAFAKIDLDIWISLQKAISSC